MAIQYFIDEETRYPSQFTLTLIFLLLASVVVSLTYFKATRDKIEFNNNEMAESIDNPASVAGNVMPADSDEAAGIPTTATNTTPVSPPVTPVATNVVSPTATTLPAWHVINITAKTNLNSIFTQLGLNNTLSLEILKQKVADNFLQHLIPGREVHVELGPNKQFIQLQYPIDPYRLLVVRPAENNNISTTILPLQLTKHERELTGHTAGSLLKNLAQANVPKRIQDEMNSVLSWQDKSWQQNDHYTLLYNDYYFGQHEVRSGHLLAAAIEKNGKSFIAIRYIDRHGKANYYSPLGTSLHESFVRFPMHYTRISSLFSNGRWQPILHIFRPHLGVDLAAPVGTPVRAVADGVIRQRGYSGGYGNAVVLDHGHGYTTLYGHLWHFASGESNGTHVRQGQVIGYVGETGLATGPHCHFEVRINGIHYDPLKVKLPGGPVLSLKERRDFKTLANKVMAELKTQKSSDKVVG